MRFLEHRIDQVRLLNRRPHRGYRTSMFLPGYDIPLVRVHTVRSLYNALQLHAQLVSVSHDIYPIASIITEALGSKGWVEVLGHGHDRLPSGITCSAHIDTDEIEAIAIRTSLPMPDAHWSVDFTRTTSSHTGGRSGHSDVHDPIAANDLAMEILEWARSEDTPVRVTVSVDGRITFWLAWPSPGAPRSIADLAWFREIGARPPSQVQG